MILPCFRYPRCPSSLSGCIWSRWWCVKSGPTLMPSLAISCLAWWFFITVMVSCYLRKHTITDLGPLPCLPTRVLYTVVCEHAFCVVRVQSLSYLVYWATGCLTCLLWFRQFWHSCGVGLIEHDWVLVWVPVQYSVSWSLLLRSSTSLLFISAQIQSPLTATVLWKTRPASLHCDWCQLSFHRHILLTDFSHNLHGTLELFRKFLQLVYLIIRTGIPFHIIAA